jgi:hypothetical protein
MKLLQNKNKTVPKLNFTIKTYKMFYHYLYLIYLYFLILNYVHIKIGNKKIGKFSYKLIKTKVSISK